MGALKSFEDIWLLGRRTRREVGIIAREILCLKDSERRLTTTDISEAAMYDTVSLLDPQFSSDLESFFDSPCYGRTGQTTNTFL